MINISDDGDTKNCNILLFDSEKDSVVNQRIWKQWRNIAPQSGWKEFFRRMNEYGILEKKSGQSLEVVEQQLTHMAYIQFEVAQPGKYRFYEYLHPSFYRTVDPRAKDIYDFLKYLDKEMEVNIYSPDEKLVAS